MLVLHRLDLVRLLAFLWVTLSLADAGLTYLALQSATNVEGNPLAAFLLAHSEATAYGLKLITTLGVGAGLWMLASRTKHLRAVLGCELLLTGMFAAIVANNALHL